jgi:hypothetical protein
VEESGVAHAEYSGTTLHGLQLMDQRSRLPTTYYVGTGPLGAIFDDLRGRATNPSIGVVGLGAGTIAAYAKPGDAMTFFEIDEAAVKLAYDPTLFTYLRDAAAAPQIVLGDGRLSIAAVPPASYDLLVLDAFASDAVPAHLLTSEAMTTYVRAVKPGGVVAFHVSNRSYMLGPTVAATAHSLGLDAAAMQYHPDPAEVSGQAAEQSDWVIVGSPDVVTRFTERGWHANLVPGLVLTDDNPDLFRALLWFGG